MKNFMVRGMLVGTGAALLAVGCGSGGIDSGVDDSKNAADVTAEEASDICHAAFDYYSSKSSKDALCKWAGAAAASVANFAGMSDEQIQSACQDSVDACNESTQDVNPDTKVCDSVQGLPNCTATVGDVESCMTEVLDGFWDGLASAPACSAYSKAYFEEQADAEPKEPSAACKNVQSKCPSALQLVPVGGAPLPGGGDDGDEDADVGGAGPDAG